MTLSTHAKLDYKKNDRAILTGYSTDVTVFRKDFAMMNEKFRQFQNKSLLNRNLDICDQRLGLLEKLRKTEKLLLSDLKNLSVTKENNLDEVIFQISQLLQHHIEKKSGSNQTILYQYDTCLKMINDQLIHANALNKTIKNYQHLLDELKGYYSEQDLIAYKTDIIPLQNLISDQVQYLKNLSIHFSDQYNSILEKRVTLSQLASYNELLKKARFEYIKLSTVFYGLELKIIESRPKIIEKSSIVSAQILSELKKLSLLFNAALTNYDTESEQLNLDQKFFQFNNHVKVLEKQLMDFKDDDIDETYHVIFDTLQKSIQKQLTHERMLQKNIISYINQVVKHMHLSPEIAENARLLEDFKKIIDQKIEFLTSSAEQLLIGKNQRVLSSIQDIQYKVEQGTRKIPRFLQKHDNLILKLKERESHFEMIEKKLNKLDLRASVDKFPTLRKSRKHIHSLLQKMDKYKKSLGNLAKKIQQHAEELSLCIRDCKSTMNFLDNKNKFKKIYGALADEYEAIIKEVMNVEDEWDVCNKVVIDENSNSDGLLDKEVKLCQQLKETLNAEKKHFAKYYQTFTVEKSEEFRSEQNKIIRINFLLQSIYDHLTIIEVEMAKAGCDTSGIILFKKEFASILINNTVHEEDLEKPVKKYLEWLHFLENSDAIDIHSEYFFQAIQRCRAEFIQVQNELTSWRTSTSSYTVSTTMRIFSPAIFTMLAIVIPGANLLPSGLTLDPGLMNNLKTATETVVKVGSKQVYQKVVDTLSPTERGNGSEEQDFSEKHTQNKEIKNTIAGKQRVINTTKDDCKLSLDLSYLWKETLHSKIKKSVFNKSMVLTSISASISLSLGITGVGTPLAILLLMCGTAAGTMSMTAYDEYQHCVREAQIRFQSEERLKKIDETIRSLEKAPERHILNKYFISTMDFIRRFVIQMKVGKDDLNVNVSLLHMLDSLAIILNIPRADLSQPTTTTDLNIEVKRQDLTPLCDFLKTEAEGKEGLMTAINFVNSNISLEDEKAVEKAIAVARQCILKLENILKTLRMNCGIDKTPLQKSFDILHELQPRLAQNDRFFKSPETVSFLKIQKSSLLLLGEISPYWTENLNRFGIFQLDMEKMGAEIEYDLHRLDI